MAIQQCGGEPETGYRYTAYFHFNRNTEMEKERYARTVKLYGKRNDTEAAVASAIYNGMYGKKILPYTGNRNEWTEDIDTGFHQIPDEAGLYAGMDGLQ